MRRIHLLIGLLAGLVLTAPPAEAQPCGGPCRQCAAELGLPLDARGIPIHTTNVASANRAWDACLERRRAELKARSPRR